jgi:hypothetical protein
VRSAVKNVNRPCQAVRRILPKRSGGDGFCSPRSGTGGEVVGMHTVCRCCGLSASIPPPPIRSAHISRQRPGGITAAPQNRFAMPASPSPHRSSPDSPLPACAASTA